MGSRKCCVEGCSSSQQRPEDLGVTFHKLPQRPEFRQRWITACRLNADNTEPSRASVCSRHFLKADFQAYRGKKYLLKQGVVPSVFPWNRRTSTNNQTPTASSVPGIKTPPPSATTPEGMPSLTPQKQIDEIKQEPMDGVEVTDSSLMSLLLPKEEVKTEIKEEKSPIKAPPTEEPPMLVASVELTTPTATPTTAEPSKRSSKKGSGSKKRRSFFERSASSKKKAKKDKSRDRRMESPRKLAASINFASGTRLEAQDFNKVWHAAKVVEVDTDEREVLIHFETKTTNALSDEWIPMDSSRLRPLDAVRSRPMLPPVSFKVGDRCMARWNDSRKFKATIQKKLDNDLYEVLFDDGYVKLVKGNHISALKQPALLTPKVEPGEESTVVASPNLSLVPPTSKLRIPEYVKVKKFGKNIPEDFPVPEIPRDGEWCCFWFNDCPVGFEALLEGNSSPIYTVLVDDWRMPAGWEKHCYQRLGNYIGKWEVFLVSPEGRKFRSKPELKLWLDERGEPYDPEKYDFCMHKKRSKTLGLMHYTPEYKTMLAPSAIPVGGIGEPPIAGGASEVQVGSLKVKIVDNLYECPKEGCAKTFRKENHLQIHIKHYHEEMADSLGVCPNMQELAYLRTTTDDLELSTSKFLRKLSESATQEEKKVIVKEELNIEAEKMETDDDMPLAEVKILTTSPNIAAGCGADANDAEALLTTHALTKSSAPSLKQRRIYTKTGKYKRKKFASASLFGESPELAKLFEPTGRKLSEAYVDENGKLIKIERMRKEEIINCICAYTEEDGLMIQCELCLCWQHGICNGIDSDAQVPEKYVCLICRNPKLCRMSQRFVHDQDWLYEGKLPAAAYHLPYPRIGERFALLKQSHTLTGNLIELRRFLHSLNVKISIAANKDHPKMYLWSKRWEESPPRGEEGKQETSILAGLLTGGGGGGDQQQISNVPQPEAAIEPAECQKNLLDHIQKQQSLVAAKLQMIEAQVVELESQDDSMDILESDDPENFPKTKQILHKLIKDMQKMKTLAEIHASIVPTG